MFNPFPSDSAKKYALEFINELESEYLDFDKYEMEYDFEKKGFIYTTFKKVQ